VASLGLVLSGAVTDGVLEKKTDDLFLVIAVWKVMTFLAVVSSPLPSSHFIYPVLFLNSATTKFYTGVTPGWYHPRTPDATEYN